MKDTNHKPRVGSVRIVKSEALEMLLTEHAHLFNAANLGDCPLYDLEEWSHRIAFGEGMAALLDHFAKGGSALKPFHFVVVPGPRRLQENEQFLEAAAKELVALA